MANFPTMYHHGKLVHTPVVMEGDGYATFPTIRDSIEGGYAQTRARFTRNVRRWSLQYRSLSSANKFTLRAFEVARVGGSESFTWVSPIDGASYTVRFADRLGYTPVDNTNRTRWDVTMELEEV